jgi:hypothetical protein
MHTHSLVGSCLPRHPRQWPLAHFLPVCMRCNFLNFFMSHTMSSGNLAAISIPTAQELEGWVAKLGAADTVEALKEVANGIDPLLEGLWGGTLTGQGSQDAWEELLRRALAP